MRCDVCAKEMTSPSGETLIGMTLTVTALPPTDRSWIQKQLGRFKVNTTYNICWECLLLSLGVRVKTPNYCPEHGKPVNATFLYYDCGCPV